MAAGEAHRRAGHTVVLASSATRFQVEPAARAMGVEHVLVTPVEIEDGICTGRPGGPPLWRAGKAAAVRAFAAEHGIDLAQSYAYSNGDEDVPFLRTVGRRAGAQPRPRAGRGGAPSTAGRSRASARAAAAGRSRSRAPSAGVGGMLGGFGAGLALGALNGSRREAVDLGITLAGELGTALAGVRLDVRGAEHLSRAAGGVPLQPPEPARRADPGQAAARRLHRRGEEGGGERPGFGLLFRLADVAFVDRGDPAQARAALEPAVQRLREGISLVIAPEGTRSADPGARARSRRAPSTSRCRPGCRSCRS